MPTTKTRMSVTASPDMEWSINRLAKRDGVSVSAKIKWLIEQALDLEEDLVLGAIADARSKQKVKYISHEQAWKGIK